MPYKDKQVERERKKIYYQTVLKHRKKERAPYDKEKVIFRKYGLTADEYNQLFIEQDFCCKICSTHITELKRGLHVDHDHSTGEVRGLLCDRCNRCLGLLKDNPVIISRALKYLERKI